MAPPTEEHAQVSGKEIRDFAKMHVDLARTEVRQGSTRFVWGMWVLIWALQAGTLAVLAACASLYLALQSILSPAGAAGATAVALAAVSFFGIRIARRLMGNVRSLSLPRTREMLGELFPWRENKNGS